MDTFATLLEDSDDFQMVESKSAFSGVAINGRTRDVYRWPALSSGTDYGCFFL